MEQSSIDSSSLQSSKLKNHYWGLRHGISEANQLGIIACDPLGLGQKYGITEHGRSQLRLSVAEALTKYPQLKHCIFYVSPLKRAIETANEAAQILSPKEIIISPELRERDFAKFDGQSALQYPQFWAEDKRNPHSHPFGGESVWEVRQRFVSLIHQIESQHHGQSIVLISHGDPLQIGQTAFENIDPSLHRESIQHLNPGDIRQLNP